MPNTNNCNLKQTVQNLFPFIPQAEIELVILVFEMSKAMRANDLLAILLNHSSKPGNELHQTLTSAIYMAQLSKSNLT
jgi:hypothetical protein